MSNSDSQKRTNPIKGFTAKDPLLFVIPNPFDDFLRKKTGWYLEIKKVEKEIKSIKECLEQVAQRQAEHRNVVNYIKEYSLTIPKRANKITKLQHQGLAAAQPELQSKKQSHKLVN